MEEQKKVGEGLPAAGDGRREELKKRTDSLAEEAEKRGEDGGRIEPKALKIDNEIASQYNELQVSNAQTGWCYRWVYTGGAGQTVMRARVDGWKVVQGEDPEAKELIAVDTTRKLGDVVLMKIPDKEYEMLQARDRRIRAVQQGSVTQEIVEMGKKYGGRIQVQTNLDSKAMQRLAMRSAAAQVAGNKFAEMLRKGTVPGMELE
jgi:hypothetical protein